jgi:MYXO-CTERM domain-containing protein
MADIGPYDRHLYPNYLGNNPGNQGRNYSGITMIVNPFVGQNGNTDQLLAVIATTGKDEAEKYMPEKKLSAYITVVPIAQTPPTGTGSGSGSGSGATDTGTGTGNEGNETTLGGCSTSGAEGGLATLLLIGLAGFIRRRK